MNHDTVISTLKRLGDRATAAQTARYFKTGEGEYGHGDRFLGVRMPELRRRVAEFQGLSIPAIKRLLRSEFHEVRQFALLILVRQFERGDEQARQRIFDLYLANTRHINNWDLVDISAPYIVGPWLARRDKAVLYELATSSSLWERRIAMLATFYFIRNEKYRDTLRLAARLRDDPEDLIHKAVGWMLREVGNRDRAALEGFLGRHYRNMPRTMLRYAIEKFPQGRRRAYLQGEV